MIMLFSVVAKKVRKIYWVENNNQDVQPSENYSKELQYEVTLNGNQIAHREFVYV